MVGRSCVWSFYKKSDSEKGVAFCNLCGKKMKTGGGTSNLRAHLKSKHPEAHEAATAIHSGAMDLSELGISTEGANKSSNTIVICDSDDNAGTSKDGSSSTKKILKRKSTVTKRPNDEVDNILKNLFHNTKPIYSSTNKASATAESPNMHFFLDLAHDFERLSDEVKPYAKHELANVMFKFKVESSKKQKAAKEVEEVAQ